ncbi:capsular biosynthesis protein [Sulfuricurvum sp.]|uniref:capsule biosynthesis protein n=1 Tax=Sulfuricurvum sp. TaxID=2025608 RepID=UPI002605AF72|nr:capsular biosynthesis protein [Sulfuricurvum sp.]MDD2781612.1 capsular biosynthesis protein [Sulfuricurvum sp.]
MVHRGLSSFRDKKIVLLQGPVGPFFKNLAEDLEEIGANVQKINFNGGDWFFSSGNAINFTGKLEEWSGFFSDFIEQYAIDTVILFGDCREYHRVAHAIASQRNLDIGIFEEGYVRPDFITFEEFGVNGNSQLSRNPNFYKTLDEDQFSVDETTSVGNTFWWAAGYAIVYYFFSALLAPFFRHYQHHRSLSLWETVYWIRSIWRKQWYRLCESGMQNDLITNHSKKYYLLPLQISTDAQVREHSHFSSVEHFIEKSISSFASYSPKDTLLIIKHHPLDRGYHDYAHFIKRVADHHNVTHRVHYIHDQHLPSLLDNALGVVMINSTVGLSALHHNTPLKACGTAIYDFEGLTYQNSLEHFWNDAQEYEIDRDLYQRFKGYVIMNKQINGNFYKTLEESRLKCGVLW